MKRVQSVLLTGFALGFLSALLTIPGCGKPDTRTLTVFQFQSTETYAGQFRIETSELPPDAIKKRTDSGETGQPETRLELDMDYEFEVVLRLVKNEKNSATDGDKPLAPGDDPSTSL
jgi:hypothetical protein